LRGSSLTISTFAHRGTSVPASSSGTKRDSRKAVEKRAARGSARARASLSGRASAALAATTTRSMG
jgi:hypothetical protein